MHGNFLPYMSAVDALFSVGPGTLDILREGAVGAAVENVPPK
jgi:hypothetical protein